MHYLTAYPASIKLFSQSLTCITISLLFSTSVSAAYLFTAPPRETAEQGQALYGPLVEQLSKVTKKKITYYHPKNWHEYKKNVQSGKFDLIFDGPQFAAWRIEHKKAKPLVKLSGKLSFTLVSHKDNPAIKHSKDLLGKTVCNLPSPNLGTLALYAMYPNPMQQPHFISIKGGFEKIVDSFITGKCDGALLNTTYLKTIDNHYRSKMKVVSETSMPTNQGITISERVDATTRRKLRAYLISEKGNAAARILLERFTHGSSHFVVAKESDYAGQNLLEYNMIFGW